MSGFPTQGILETIAATIVIWLLARLGNYLKNISNDFKNFKDLPEKVETITTRQMAQGEQIRVIVEKLIEQGPPKHDKQPYYEPKFHNVPEHYERAI